MTRLAAMRRSFPTLILLGAPVRWVGRSRRRIVTVALLALAVIASPPLWWATQLVGLPDIGDPFDVAAFLSVTVPDDQNAFVLYSRAASLLTEQPKFPPQSSTTVEWLARWPEAVPEVRRWALENREALAIYRQGCERPDAFNPAVGFDGESWKAIGRLWPLRLIALLEASRLEEQGDMAGAWGWYKALLRTAHHVGMHAAVDRRTEILVWHKELHKRLTTWADDPRTSPVLLRQAIDDVTACEALAPSERDSLKAGYLTVIKLLDSPVNPGRAVPLMRFRQFWHPDFQLNPEQIQEIWDAWRSWRREPERSRRLIRLVTANWLAYLDLPVGDRPKPDPTVASFDFYTFGPRSPAQARALAPEAVDRWFDTAYDAQKVLRYLDATAIQIAERANHADLLILLGSQLYHRDHGSDPPTPAALVGPYLQSLPTEYLDTNAPKIR